MRITESNVSQWGPRPDDAAAAARASRIGRDREQRTATIASQVDRNPRDGWIDEFDLPYDQLELLERARAAAAREAAREEPRPELRVAREAPAPAPVEAPAPRVDVTAVDTAEAPPQIDLLA